jgi:hypothetical protein
MVVEPRGQDTVTRLAIARMAVGVAGFLAPKRVGRAWIGGEGASPLVAVVTRAFAVRDFALGLGAYLAVQRGAPVRGWVEAGVLSDAADVLATLRSPVPLARRLLIAATALSAVAGGALALQSLEEPSPPAAG